MRILTKGIILICVPLILSVIITGSLYSLLLGSDRQRLQQTRNRQAVEHSVTATFLLYDLGNDIKDLLTKSQNKVQLREQFKQHLATLRQEEDLIVADDTSGSFAPIINRERQELDATLNEWLDTVKSLRGHLSIGAVLNAQNLIGRGTVRRHSLVCASQSLVSQVLLSLKEYPLVEQRLFDSQIQILVGGTIFGIIFGFWLARLFMKGIVERIGLMVQNTHRLSKGLSLAPPMSGCDEIAQLDAEFHSMASALNSAKAKEHTLFVNASDMIAVLNAELQLMSVNPASYQLLGFEPQGLMQLGLLDLVHPDDRDRTIQAFMSGDDGSNGITLQNRIRHQLGHYLDIDWSACWSQSREELCAVAHDVTEQRRIEREKREFLSMVSHDLRSPLCSISFGFELILKGIFGSFPQSAAATLNAIRDNIQALLKLVNDLLDLEKLEAGRLTMTKRLTDIDSIVDQAIEEVESIAQRKQVLLVAETGDDNAEYEVDAERIVQSIANVLSFVIAGTSNATILLKCFSDSNQLRFQLTDSSSKLTAEQASSLFESYRQAPIGSTSDSPVALGLVLSKQIIEAHNGTLRVEPAADGGITYHIALRIVDDIAISASLRALGPDVQTLQRGGQFTNSTELGLSRVPPRSQMMARGAKQPILSRLNLLQKGLLLVAVPIVFEITFAGLLFAGFSESFKAEQRELHYRIVATTSHNLVMLSSKFISEMNLAKEEKYWNDLQGTFDETVTAEQELLKLTKDDPELHNLAQELQVQLKPLSEYIDRARQHIKEYGVSEETLAVALDSKTKLDSLPLEISPTFQKLFEACERATIESPGHLSQLRANQGVMLVAGLLISLLISLGSAVLFGLEITKRLKTMAYNMERVKAGADLRDVVAGSDEIAQLDAYFHSMVLALREASNREKAVFANSRDVLCTIDTAGTVINVNPACFTMWQIPASELVGSLIQSVMDETSSAKMLQTLSTLSIENPTAVVETAITNADGASMVASWSLSCAEGSDQISAVAHDITQSESLRKLREDFLRIIAGRMKAPLLVIAQSTESLIRDFCGGLDPAVSQRLESIATSCSRLLRLTNSLDEMDKLSSGQMELKLSTVYTDDLLKRTADALGTFALSKGVNLVIESCERNAINGDPDRLMQVCINLVSNAIKFSPPDSCVRLYSQVTGEVVRIYIQDFGRGIPESHVESIFEPFSQVEAADGKRAAGTGLGLPICKRLVAEHGGEMFVESQLGQGSIFSFTIPRTVMTTKVPG